MSFSKALGCSTSRLLSSLLTATLKRPRRSALDDHKYCRNAALVISSRKTTLFSTATNENNNTQDASQSRAVRSVYDSSPNWEDWFTPEEYGNAWEYRDPSEETEGKAIQETKSEDYVLSAERRWILEALQEDVGLDASSRHLIRQMQMLYQDGYQNETITTQRCQHMIGQLLESAESIAKSHKGQGDDGASLIRQRVIRTEAILRTMELFWDFVPDLLQDGHANNPQSQQRKTLHSGSKPVTKWPLPTHGTYVDVLRGLNTLRFPKQYQSLDNSDVPWVCQDLVLRFHRLHLVKGFSYLKKPLVEEWNQALSCWANAHGSRDHSDKALHATQLLLDMGTIHKVVPDASSYSHVFRACAHHDQDEKAMELGGRLAVKVWKGVMQEELMMQTFTPTPFCFVFLMRALALLGQGREQYLKEVWEEAYRAGVVNEHVLYELEQASTPLFRDLLNSYRKLVDTKPLHSSLPAAYDKTYHRELLKWLPAEWSKRAKTENSGDPVNQTGSASTNNRVQQ